VGTFWIPFIGVHYRHRALITYVPDQTFHDTPAPAGMLLEAVYFHYFPIDSISCFFENVAL
jgi:hypothetical protein